MVALASLRKAPPNGTVWLAWLVADFWAVSVEDGGACTVTVTTDGGAVTVVGGCAVTGGPGGCAVSLLGFTVAVSIPVRTVPVSVPGGS